MGVSHEAIPEPLFEVGDSGIDPDHRALAELLDALERVCTNPATPDGRCDHCPETKAHSCHALLREISVGLQTLLLDHFQREHELMNSLPRNAATRAHCERHRREHVNFFHSLQRRGRAAQWLPPGHRRTGGRDAGS